MNTARQVFIFILLTLIVGCGLNPHSDVGVLLRVEEPQQRASRDDLPVAPPESALDFECYVLSASGLGVVRTLEGAGDCLRLGTLSPAISKDTLLAQGIALRVKAGPARLLRLIGVTGTGRTNCGADNLPAILRLVQPKLFELGAQQLDLFNDADVQLPNRYQAILDSDQTPVDLFDSCTNDIPGLTFLTPAQLTHAYVGQPRFSSLLGGDVLFSDKLGGTLPPTISTLPGMVTLTEVTGPLIPLQQTAEPSSVNVGFTQLRADLVFDLSALDLSRFGQVVIEASVKSGFTPFVSHTCDLSTVTDSLGMEMRVYEGRGAASSLGEWSALSARNPSATEAVVRWPATGSAETRNLSRLVTLENAGTTSPHPFLHLSFRALSAPDFVNARCVTMKISAIRIQLFPALADSTLMRGIFPFFP